MSKKTTAAAAAAAAVVAGSQGPAVDQIAQLEQRLREANAAYDAMVGAYGALQEEYLHSQTAALRYIAALVFDSVGKPGQSRELVEQAVERAITAAVENGKTDAEAKAMGYDVARARGRDHGGELTLSKEALERAASMVIERAETSDGNLVLRVLTQSDLAERSVQAMQQAPMVEEQADAEPGIIAEHKPVLAKAHKPLILPPGV